MLLMYAIILDKIFIWKTLKSVLSVQQNVQLIGFCKKITANQIFIFFTTLTMWLFFKCIYMKQDLIKRINKNIFRYPFYIYTYIEISTYMSLSDLLIQQYFEEFVNYEYKNSTAGVLYFNISNLLFKSFLKYRILATFTYINNTTALY